MPRPDYDFKLIHKYLGSVLVCGDCMYIQLHMQRFEGEKGKMSEIGKMEEGKVSDGKRAPTWHDLTGRRLFNGADVDFQGRKA